MKKIKFGRSLLACVLALTMMLSACGTAFATGGEVSDPVTINYVSLGDSMSNGYCFDGYEQGEAGINFLSGTGVYGYAAYPNLFADKLEELYGAGTTVNHTKLAPSAMRAEDLNFLLGGREEAIDGWENQVNGYTGEDDETLAQFYQESIANADVITMGIGNASFGAFMLHRVTDALGIFGASLDEDEKVDLEDALAIVEPEQREVVNEIYEKMVTELLNRIPADLVEQFHVQDVCNIVAYTAAGFIVNYKGVLDQIIRLNDDAEIILVGLMNTTYGMTITSPTQDPIYIGDIMDEVFAILNAYIAGLPTVMQGMGEWQNAEFYYAEQPNPLFISQQFAALKANSWGNLDGLSGQTVRERNITAYNDSLTDVIGPAMGFNLPDIKLEYVQAFDGVDEEDLWTADWTQSVIKFATLFAGDGINYDNASDYALSTAIYLAIEDGVAASTDTMEIPLESLLTIATDIGSVFTGLDPVAMGTDPQNVRDTLGSYLTSTDILKGMCKIYALFKVGNGMSVHPTPEAHRALCDVVYEAYINGYTAKDETIKNIETLAEIVKGYIVEYYDDAYAYAYAEADAKGYVDTAAAAINQAINVIASLDIEDIQMTDEFKAELEAELAAVVATLVEVKAVLQEDKASDIDGLYESVMALKDDLNTHLAKAGAILAQAEYDVKTLLVPVIDAYVRSLISTYLGEEILNMTPEDVKEIIDGYIDGVKNQAGLQIAKIGHKPYKADEDSYYVAIGGDTVKASNLLYGDKPYYAIIGEELDVDTSIVINRQNTLLPTQVVALVEANAAEIANADLITYQTDASSFIYATLMETPDWDKYIDAETKAFINEVTTQVNEVLSENWAEYANAKIEEVIPEIKAAIIEKLPEELPFAGEIFDMAVDFVVPYILGEVNKIEAEKDEIVSKIESIDETVLEYAEKLAYAVVAYGVDTVKAIETIQAINPDATLVVAGMYNPARGLEIVTEDATINAEEIFEYVIDATNLYYATYAAADKGFAFVDVSDAQTNGFGAAIDATALEINQIAAMLMGAGASMNANVAGHAYIAEQILNSFACNCAYEALDETYHIFKCVLCGTVEKTEEHTYDDESDTTCDVCGYVRDISSGEAPGGDEDEEEEEHYYGGGGSVSNQFAIKFETNGGSAVASVTVKKGALLAEPKAPTKAGYVFAGWYTDKALTSKYDFATPVNKAFVLYAKWVSESVAKFTDLDKNAWYYDYVAAIVEKGLMKGISETEFAPNATLTRGMFVTILHRVEGEPAVEGGVNFTDVAADQYYAKAVQWANANGIVKGISETEFAPNAEVTREQMAAMIARYAEYKKIAAAAGDVTYTDSEEISEYAKDAVRAANKLGILIGNADGSFAPQRNSTRAEAAALFVRLLDVLKK